LLDEATVGLDVQSRAGILANIRRLVKTEGTSAFWATHLIDEVKESDHVVVLVDGNLVANAGVADVMRSTETKSIGDAFSRLNRKEKAAAPEDLA
jgi:ABC-2 type transport system ATP-binding protein